MALTMIPVTGRLPTPLDGTAQAITLHFRLSGLDLSQGEAVLPVVEPVALDENAELPDGFALFANSAGLRGTTYTGEAVWIEVTPRGRLQRSIPLRRFQVDEDHGPYTIA